MIPPELRDYVKRLNLNLTLPAGRRRRLNREVGAHLVEAYAAELQHDPADPERAARAVLERMGQPTELALLANARRAPWSQPERTAGLQQRPRPSGQRTRTARVVPSRGARPRSAGVVYLVLSTAFAVLVAVMTLSSRQT